MHASTPSPSGNQAADLPSPGGAAAVLLAASLFWLLVYLLRLRTLVMDLWLRVADYYPAAVDVVLVVGVPVGIVVVAHRIFAEPRKVLGGALIVMGFAFLCAIGGALLR